MGDERAPNAIDQKLGQRVRSRRLELGMSQERLAELLGITFQQVQKYERGANRIAASRLHDLAIALDMPVARFFDGLSVARKTTSASTARDLDDALAKPGAHDLLRTYASITSPRVRRRILELVKAMSEEA
jgi:transcriptional regulator with XRE-family HTH domain